VECASNSCGVPTVATAASISSISDMPVESISGLPVDRIARSKW
jgi:hypothetical protein